MRYEVKFWNVEVFTDVKSNEYIFIGMENGSGHL
jgi:hypothetical protein